MVVLLEDTLTTGERNLVASGREEAVVQMRRALEDAMRPELTAIVEGLTGARVDALLTASNVEPDVAVAVFVLDRAVGDGA